MTPAALDVGDETNRHAGPARKTHIGDVTAPEVDLRRTAGALDDNEFELTAKPPETLEHGFEQCAATTHVIGGTTRRHRAAVDDHLRRAVGLRFEQHRVEVNTRCQTGGLRLQRLGAADLTAVRTGGRVVGHVLRLEGGDGDAAAARNAHERGGQDGLADVRTRALEHQCAGRHSAPSICTLRPSTPARTP